jgi:hypothetical protein
MEETGDWGEQNTGLELGFAASDEEADRWKHASEESIGVTAVTNCRSSACETNAPSVSSDSDTFVLADAERSSTVGLEGSNESSCGGSGSGSSFESGFELVGVSDDNDHERVTSHEAVTSEDTVLRPPPR